MNVYKAIVAYDGTHFHGFQRQASGVRTVQGVLEEALRTLGWQEHSLLAAGRTDRGVHAAGQVITFSMAWRRDPETLLRACNACLPNEVAVRALTTVDADFHPRFSASQRHYRYQLLVDPLPDPLRERFAWRIWPEADRSLLVEAAEALIGRRDFGAFGRAPIEGGHTQREIIQADWQFSGADWRFDIAADAFLHHMVRRLIAAMLAVGQGQISLPALCQYLENPQNRWDRRLAPPHGLCLMAVDYDR